MKNKQIIFDVNQKWKNLFKNCKKLIKNHVMKIKLLMKNL